MEHAILINELAGFEVANEPVDYSIPSTGMGDLRIRKLFEIAIRFIVRSPRPETGQHPQGMGIRNTQFFSQTVHLPKRPQGGVVLNPEPGHYTLSKHCTDSQLILGLPFFSASLLKNDFRPFDFVTVPSNRCGSSHVLVSIA